MKILAGLLVAVSAFAVDGTILNKTTGKPQAGAPVTLFKLGGASGMEQVDSATSDSQGKFNIKLDAQGPVLVQAEYEGVTYSRMITPGTPLTGIDIDVFNSTKTQPEKAAVGQHMVLFEPGDGAMTVTETVMWQNSGNVTFNNPATGTLQFYLPPEAKGQVRINCTPPGGLPLEREAEKTARANVFKIDFPIKPGDTRFDLVYQVPYTSPAEFSGKVLHKGGLTRLVAPAGVSLTGDNLKSEGQEPSTQASIFTLNAPDYKVKIEGTGAVRAGAAATEEENQGPGIQQILPRIYDRLYLVLGLSFAILAIGFYLFYRREREQPKPAAPVRSGKRA